MSKLFKIWVSIFFGTISSYSQEIHSALQVRNSHLWRGIEVTSGLTFTGDLHLDYKNFYAGFWGGGNADGTYKEFNNYIGYKNKHLVLELWDIYNFSPNATYNNKEFFNYNAKETGRFMDFRSYYTISDKLPLVLSWNTVIFGRDRDLENTGNKYSTFVSAEYPVYKKDGLEVRTRLGYSFAFNNPYGEKSNFFSKKAGFNEISLIVSKPLKIGNYEIPLGLWGMWNPVDDHAYLQFSAQVYSF
ncbi:hypothetical protein BAX94_17025 [Elizabethkingia meningoseptica]|uniref:DUF5020 domain-containing protein n=2 Tax=Elizabethkingia meningoseptica TaxID=238 RepID=A0A1V3TYZ1_ELIME|nr:MULTISPECIES: hypothetical protein [Elizabethkingia]AQX04170.1 hypothetical protein BBD33_02415 [Elizabethkingia meningoseptica]AQX11630.1 hypothetical protein BBD35_04215 [Elizabethkingia meningoseptica]AQX46211.1 hypothetical protein B5G46_02410 [Elizabethkingia meningoseptica]EOR30725.1 hypothetical protein L100_04347 [Elizabethkingia meningoseptica ATCC 13253 = NBRC 12535]KUY18727.1 hypothetical protein ATB99_02820 [Elizabethkingia meningoseptica]